MTSYARKRRRLSDLSARDIDELRIRHDVVELDRYLADQERREPREDRFERAQARWLTPVDPSDFAA